MRTTTTKLLALGTAAALGLAACGNSAEDSAPAVSGEPRPVQEQPAAAEGEQATDEGTEVEATTDDAASTLRAELTALLQEHVHLTGLAVDAVAEEGRDAPAAEAAIRALDENATALGDVMGGIPSVDDPDALLEPWREHVAAYVDHAAARANQDDDAAADATAALEDVLQPMADFFEQISDEEIVADEIFGELETHVTMVTDAIDAHVAGDDEAHDLWRDAALQMDSVATDVAEGIVAAHPDELAGDPLSVPAETRATLTSSLVEHTYLTLLAAGEAADAEGAADDPAVQSAVTALDSSADDLANAVSGASGNEGRDAFLDVWRPFLTAATDYAAARAAGDAAAAEEARATIEATPSALADVLQGSTAGNAPGDLTELLSTHVTNLLGAVDAMVADDPAAYAQARAAAAHASTIAAGLAGALVAAGPASGDGDGGGGGDLGATRGEDAEGLNADPSTAAPDQSAEGTSDAGTVGTNDAGAATDNVGPGAEAGSEGDVDGQE